MAFSRITLTHDENAADMGNILNSVAGNKLAAISKVVAYFGALSGGFRKAKMTVAVGAVQASGTLTGSTVVATNTAVINGVTFTAVASGATGNQFNVGANGTETMANLAAAINASATALVSGYVTAAAAAEVVTVTAVRAGKEGNCMTLAATGAITAGSTRLANGDDGTEVTNNFGSAS